MMDNLKELIKHITVVDLETTINATNPNHFGATPFDPTNRIVMVGWTNIEVFRTGYTYTSEKSTQSLDWVTMWCQGLSLYKLYVGHNIPFDLHHLLKDATQAEYHQILSEIWIWDTMIAEYYMSRQESKSISLESLASLYGIPFKKDETVAESFKAGLGADKVDPTILKTYLKSDVTTTREIFLKQHKRALDIGGPEYVEYLLEMMSARLTTMLMERNGCTINTKTFMADKWEISSNADRIEAELEGHLIRAFGPDFDGEVSIRSPKQVHTYLFGGVVKTKQQVDTGEVYKTGPKKGTQKLRTVHVDMAIPGILPVIPEVTKLAGEGSVGDKVLKDLLLVTSVSFDTPCHEFIENLLLLRTLHKDVGTYETYEKQFYPINSTDSKQQERAILHPNFNHALTHTKRPSCSQPNLQNVSNKDTIETLDEH